MRYNQYSYVLSDKNTIEKELGSIGFYSKKSESDKGLLRRFIQIIHRNAANSDLLCANLLATANQDLLTFFQSEDELTANIFYLVALQILGFVPGVDFEIEELATFLLDINFPLEYGDLTQNFHQLLNTRMKNGNTLIDRLVSEGLLPEDNHYHFFNGKTLATFNTHDNIREVVYVESPVDTDFDAQPDLIKVSIIRPHHDGQIPVIMTQSPYHQGVNEKANDQQLHKMEGQLQVKEARHIEVRKRELEKIAGSKKESPVSEATEKLGHIDFYTLNDYFLARGFANLYVSGVGTLGSDGFMTSGDYQQVESFKAVVDWLNGRACAFTDRTRSTQVEASWSNGKVATTGISYLGTLSNALATTGVDGLEVAISEAGISSWYDYYREKGLVVSPGGYPGEDLDVLTAFTYSRCLQAGDALRQRDTYRRLLDEQTAAIDRTSGDYNQYWHDRNYLPHAHKVQCEMVFTHGSQDWNVKPIHVYQMFKALPSSVKKHLFLHNGAHVYMNNWQSIDFRESMNALLTKKLLGINNSYELPNVIWQDNHLEQAWIELETFGGQQEVTLPLGHGQAHIQNQYESEIFKKYAKTYSAFKADLYEDKANQVTVDLTLEEDVRINGRLALELKVKSSVNKGLLSAQILDFGTQPHYGMIPTVKSARTMDNGRYFSIDSLMELPRTEVAYRVISTGHLNLQNRHDLLNIESVEPDEWMTFTFELQPTIYQMKKGDTLRIILYTTDFEHTIRDNGDWTITVDLAASSLKLPY